MQNYMITEKGLIYVSRIYSTYKEAISDGWKYCFTSRKLNKSRVFRRRTDGYIEYAIAQS